MPKRILIADDDPGIGDMLQMMLEEAGYEVEIQEDGHAVQQMQRPLPDLLFLDIRLSGTDGLTICRYLKSQEATHALPTIPLSSRKDTCQIARDTGPMHFWRSRSRSVTYRPLSQKIWATGSCRASSSLQQQVLFFFHPNNVY